MNRTKIDDRLSLQLVCHRALSTKRGDGKYEEQLIE